MDFFILKDFLSILEDYELKSPCLIIGSKGSNSVGKQIERVEEKLIMTEAKLS